MGIKNIIYKFRYYFYVYLILVIQISLINNGLLFSIYPNILLVYVAFVSQKLTKNASYIIALLSGMFYDVLLSPNFGIRALTFFVIAILINKVSEYIFSENFKSSFLYTSISILVYNTFIHIIYYFLSYKVNFSNILYNYFSLETLLSVLIFYLMVSISRKRSLKELIIKRNRFYKLKLKKGKSSETDSN